MLSTYIATGKISNEVAKDIVKFRNGYSYPNVRLVLSTKKTELKISEDLWAAIDETKFDKPTDLELDHYHFSLLSSSNPADNLLGTASVIFWGYYTFSKNYSINKLMWHLQGYKSKPATTPSFINDKLLKIKNETNNGLAVALLSDISQLGSLPFASKVIAFLRPDKAGIYDNQIHNGLLSCEWYKKSNLNTLIGRVNKTNVQDGYTRWCSFLSQLANILNDGVAKGNDWKWTDYSGQKSMWRAVDVERSLFNYYKSEKSFNFHKINNG